MDQVLLRRAKEHLISLGAVSQLLVEWIEALEQRIELLEQREAPVADDRR